MAKEKPLPPSAVRKKIGVVAGAMSVMNAMPDPVIAFDSMLKISFSNKAAQNFFSLKEKQILGKYMVELLGQGNIVFETVENVVRKSVTMTLQKVSVKGRAVGSVIVATIDENLFMMIIREKPLKVGHELEEAPVPDATAIEHLAEELKQPLADIHAAAKRLGKDKLTARQKELAARIARRAQEMQGLLAEFNILPSYEPELGPDDRQKTLNLRDVHQQVTRIAQESYGRDLEIREYYDPALPDIRGNFDLLVQAKLNLIRNAAEAFANAKKKGEISIRTFYDEAAADHDHKDGKRPLCIEIEDNGKGISPDLINRIFLPYFTTKKNSQGLGLPVTSKIVSDHGGTIKVDSKPGKTVFRINLPMLLEPPKPGGRRR